VLDPTDEFYSLYVYVGNALTVAIDKDGNVTDWLTIGNKAKGIGFYGTTGAKPLIHNPNEPWWLSAPVWILAGNISFVTFGFGWGAAAGFSLEGYSSLYYANAISGSISNTLFNDY